MFTRILLILTFVLQPALLRLGGLGGLMPPEWGAMACCEVIETSACHEGAVVDVVCDMTGGDCHCRADPVPQEQPKALPLVRDSSELTLVLAPRTTGVAPAWPPTTGQVSGMHILGRTVRSHNEVQALLGIWLT